MKTEIKNYSDVLDLFDEAKNHHKYKHYSDENCKLGRIKKWEMTKKGKVKWIIKYIDNTEKVFTYDDFHKNRLCTIPFKYLHPDTNKEYLNLNIYNFYFFNIDMQLYLK